MALPNKPLSALVSDMVAAWAQQLGYQPTLPDGDPLLALMQATAAQAVFLQAQIQIVNAPLNHVGRDVHLQIISTLQTLPRGVRDWSDIRSAFSATRGHCGHIVWSFP